MKRAVLSKDRGFTLAELILVMVIMGTLAAIILPKFLGQTEQAKIAATKSNLSSLRSAVRMFAANNNGALPTNLTTDLVQGTPQYIRAIAEEAITPSAQVVSTRDNTGGWVYDSATGTVMLNLSGPDDNGDNYEDY